MRNVEGTITDPRMDRLIDGNNHTVPIEEISPVVLTLDAYQEAAASTAIYPRVYTEDQVSNMLFDAGFTSGRVEFLLDEYETDFSRLVYPVLGLVGESGELANKLKKVARDGKGMQTDEQAQEIVQELGDVLWYVAAVAEETNTSLGLVALANLKKLFSRRDRGVLGGSGDTR